MNLIKLDLSFLCLILHLIILSLSPILPPLTKEVPCPAATFNITERSTATDTILIDTLQSLSHQETASTTNEAIDYMFKTSIAALEVILLVKYEKKLN